MKFARTLLIAGSATLFALGSAFAAGKGEGRSSSNDPGFNSLDRNGDGKLSRSEAERNPYLAKRFKEADRNGDGSLSRFEYLRTMTAKDLGTIKEKVSGGKKDSSASAGSTKSKQDR